MLRRFFGNNGTREHGPSIQVLDDQKKVLMDTLEVATRTPKIVEIGNEKFAVTADGYGKRVKKIEQD